MAASSRRSVQNARAILAGSRRVALDTLFPPRCPGCRRRGTWLCPVCRAQTPLIAFPRCGTCGQPSNAPCICAELPVPLDAVQSALWYEGWVAAAIQWFKYEGEFARRDSLARFLEAEMLVAPPCDAVIPVPLHPRRERTRGYNQSLLLAAAVCEAAGLPLEPVLERTRNTRRQVGLHASERSENMAEAFQVRAGAVLTGRRYLLIDDVMTTGSTLGACAAALKQGGASWVGALTLARER